MRNRFKHAEPWMLDSYVEITELDGSTRRVYGEIGRFSLLGRIRMAGRRLLGKPAWQMLPPVE